MRNPRHTLIIGGIATLMVAILLIVTLTFYAGSSDAKSSLLVKYFRMLSSDDPASISELTSATFKTDLDISRLERGAYELYDFGEIKPGTVRFLIVVPESDGKKRAIIADMAYIRRGISNLVESIMKVDEGSDIKE